MAARRVIVGSLVLHLLATYDHAYSAVPPVDVIERALTLYLAGCVRRIGHSFGYRCSPHSDGWPRHFRRFEREPRIGDADRRGRRSANCPGGVGRERRIQSTDADPGGWSPLCAAEHSQRAHACVPSCNVNGAFCCVPCLPGRFTDTGTDACTGRSARPATGVCPCAATRSAPLTATATATE
jgi:hypothetical protein